MIDLRAKYNFLNRKYYEGKLPKDIVLEWSERIPMGDLASCHPHGIIKCDPIFCAEDCNQSFIRLDPIWKQWDCVAHLTLLHEMSHIKSVPTGDRRYATHGPIWQEDMMRLARAGAFKDIW